MHTINKIKVLLVVTLNEGLTTAGYRCAAPVSELQHKGGQESDLLWWIE